MDRLRKVVSLGGLVSRSPRPANADFSCTSGQTIAALGRLKLFFGVRFAPSQLGFVSRRFHVLGDLKKLAFLVLFEKNN